MAQFRLAYQPLTKRDSIRLLLLQPAATIDGELNAAILHTTLSECDYDLIEPYTALSYVWGDPSSKGLIRIDGSPVGITATLDAALRDMRDPTRVRRVWADAICINQLDVPERNNQVSMMGRIYSVAQHTIIHLGNLTSTTEAIFKWAPKKSLGIPNILQSDELSEIVENAKTDILLHPWFGRVWIFQELVLSKDPWVQCGPKRIRWTDFCSLLIPRSLPLPIADDGLDSLRVVESMNTARLTLSPGSLSRLLQSRRGLGATDPRDMIYAHMGLASDRQVAEKYIQINYDRNVEFIYGQAARYLFDIAGLEQLLYLAGNANSPTSSIRLPSWVPDWRLPMVNKPEMYKDNLLSRLRFSTLPHAFVDESGVLAVVGYTVGIIEETGEPISDAADVSRTVVEEWQRLETGIQTLYRAGGGTYYTGDSNGRHVHVGLRGREEEHEHLGNLLFQNFEDAITSPPGYTGEPPAFFRTWAQQAAAAKRILVGRESQGLLHLMHDYMHPKIKQNCLEGRRLATTTGGLCGVVPARARKGDLVVNLAGSEMAYVVRPSTDDKELAKKIYRGLEQNHARLQVAERDDFLWEPVEADFTATCCAVVGECYFDGQVGWGLNQTPSNLEVFALH